MELPTQSKQLDDYLDVYAFLAQDTKRKAERCLSAMHFLSMADSVCREWARGSGIQRLFLKQAYQLKVDIGMNCIGPTMLTNTPNSFVVNHCFRLYDELCEEDKFTVMVLDKPPRKRTKT